MGKRGTTLRGTFHPVLLVTCREPCKAATIVAVLARRRGVPVRARLPPALARPAGEITRLIIAPVEICKASLTSPLISRREG